MKKKVLLTINPIVMDRGYFTTMRRLVRWLDTHCELLLAPINGYDFKCGKVAAFKRLADGSFKKLGMRVPHADLWIVYSDGFYLDHAALGFKVRRDYYRAQLDFHYQHMQAGNVCLLINSPEAEARTQKSWLATLDFKKFNVIPTYLFKDIAEVYDFQRAQGAIVVKPIWGGASMEVCKLSSEARVREFQTKLEQQPDRDLSDYCFQVYCRGNEKRFWFAGSKCIGARIIHGRATPWSCEASDFWVRNNGKDVSQTFARDMAAARRLCDLSGISVGSVDFVGGRINEINGGGTVLTSYDHRPMIIDTRPAFLEYVLSLLNSL